MAKEEKKVKQEETKAEESAAPEKSFDFDVNAFQSANFVERTAEVPVVNSEMKAFFPEGTTPMLLVRGLTALELARADEEVKLNREARAEELVRGIGTEAMQALKTLLRTHLEDDTPDAYIRMINIVRIGLKKPKLNHEQIMKFASAFPVEFRLAFMKINELTGRGQDFEGKPGDSGKNPESKTQ